MSSNRRKISILLAYCRSSKINPQKTILQICDLTNKNIPPLSKRCLQPIIYYRSMTQIRDFRTQAILSSSFEDRRSDMITSYKSSVFPDQVDAVQQKDMLGESLEITSVPKMEIREVNKQEDCNQLQHEQFSDHRLAYASKTTFELARTSFFYFIFQYKLFTDNFEKITRSMETVLGKTMSEFIMKKMVYNQFVAGNCNNEVCNVVNRLQKEGVWPLIAVPIEDDLGHGKGQHYDRDEVLDKNQAKILHCMQLCIEVAGSKPMYQMRITALMSPELTKLLSAACSYNENNDSNALSSAALQALVQGIQGKKMDLPQTKEWDDVATHIGELETVLKRVRAITEKIVATDIVCMVDAEYTYFNPAIRHVTLAMMEICNKHKPLVFYTYQAYLKCTYGYLKSDLKWAKERGNCLGVKLVRGAYIVKERKLAQQQGYPCPVNDDYEATSYQYRRCLDALLAEARKNEERIRFIIASHNEDSIRYAFKGINESGLSLDSKSILFGQLYGMADHVSYTLGKRGCNVVKSLPYGSVEDTIPYLARRSQENRSIFDNVRKEKNLVKTAFWERILRKS